MTDFRNPPRDGLLSQLPQFRSLELFDRRGVVEKAALDIVQAQPVFEIRVWQPKYEAEDGSRPRAECKC